MQLESFFFFFFFFFFYLVCNNSFSCSCLLLFCFVSLGYHENHPVIMWFWHVVEAYSTEQKLRLLQVC